MAIPSAVKRSGNPQAAFRLRGTAPVWTAPFWRREARHLCRTWELYLFVLPAAALVLVFRYIPIYGLRIAFTDGFSLIPGRSAPVWNHFAHFFRFFGSMYFWPVVRNTAVIALYSLAAWPIPLVLAVMLNAVRGGAFRKTVQMSTYAPYFISTVVVVSMMMVFLNPRNGVVNTLVALFGGKPVFFMGSPSWGPTLYVISDVWQTMGYNAIIFLAALSAVDLSAKEAAFCDGAGRFQIIVRIEIPWIAPTIVILFVMRLGHLFSVGFEKVLLMQNDLNVSTMEVVSTYVYRSGILDSQYDFAAAVGLLETVLNFLILISANRLARRMGQASLW